MIEIKKKSQNEFAVVVEEKGDKTQHIVSLDDDYYHLYDQAESLEELKKRATKYDEQGLSWTIDDENGKPVESSQIHKEIIHLIVRKYHGKGRSGY